MSLVAERGLVKGERIGVDGSTMEANAALRTIVRRDSGETYRAMLTDPVSPCRRAPESSAPLAFAIMSETALPWGGRRKRSPGG